MLMKEIRIDEELASALEEWVVGHSSPTLNQAKYDVSLKSSKIPQPTSTNNLQPTFNHCSPALNLGKNTSIIIALIPSIHYYQEHDYKPP